MQTKRVLIIDDEATIRTVVKFGVQMASGWKVLAASSGAEGIQTAQAEQPDVILLDMMMPGMDGMTTFKMLQRCAETEQIPVIFLTAKAQMAETQRFHDLGISGVITKPFNSLHLPEQIVRILHW